MTSNDAVKVKEIIVRMMNALDDHDDELYHKIKKEEFVQIATYFVEDFNNCSDQLTFDEKGEIVAPYSQKELNKKLKEEFAKLDNDGFIQTNIYGACALPGVFAAGACTGKNFKFSSEIMVEATVAAENTLKFLKETYGG